MRGSRGIIQCCAGDFARFEGGATNVGAWDVDGIRVAARSGGGSILFVHSEPEPASSRDAGWGMVVAIVEVVVLAGSGCGGVGVRGVRGAGVPVRS